MSERWTHEKLETAVSILRKYRVRDYDAARDEIAAVTGLDASGYNLAHAFKRKGLRPPTSYCSDAATAARAGVRPAADDLGCAHGVGDNRPGVRVGDRTITSRNVIERSHRDVDRGIAKPIEHLDALLKATRRPVPFARLCDVLDMAPAKVRRLVDEARGKGFSVAVAGDEIGWQEPEPERDEIPTGVLPVTGRRHKLIVVSDLHAGSKYFLRKQLCDFLDMAYEWAEGEATVVSAGDNVDGRYKHGVWELSHHGLEEQTEDLLDTIRPRPGMDFWFIDGNHCGTFWDETGYPTGRAIENAARARGRTDIHYLGNRAATIRHGGARIELWHPKKSGAYALSYHLQNHIRDMGLGHKPDILLAGHWHTWCYLEQRGVHAIACGTFQGGGSAFSKSLGGAPSIGGTLVSWETTDHGTLRRVAVERVAYYEKEEPREVA